MKRRLINSVYGKVRMGHIAFLETENYFGYALGTVCRKKECWDKKIVIDIFDVERNKHLYICNNLLFDDLEKSLNALYFSLLEGKKNCEVKVRSSNKIAIFATYSDGTFIKSSDCGFKLMA